jgi:tetratricopeptide (TPR) repeat protein
VHYIFLPVIATAASLMNTSPVDTAVSTSSRCQPTNIGRYDTPALVSLFKHKGEPQWQAENRSCFLYSWGLIYQLVGDYKNAITAYTYAVGWQSNLSEAYAARGDVYASLSELKKAEEDYAQASQLNRTNADALNNICWERAKRGYPLDRAMNDCDSAIKLEPGQWATWDSRCLVNYRLGNYAAAISDCDKALELWRDASYNVSMDTSHRAGSFYVRGLAKIKNGNIEDGNADVATAKDIYQDVDKKYATFGVTQ